MASSRSKRSSYKELFTLSLFLLSLFLAFFSLTLKGNKPYYTTEPSLISPTNDWLDLLPKKINTQRIKIGLVNIDDDIKLMYDGDRLVETVFVDFEPVSKSNKTWEDFFPEWIDEEQRWSKPECPEIPVARLEDYGGLDVVMARVPCGSGDEKKGIRDVLRLQVNLVVANLVVANGWAKKSDDVERTVYVVFMGSCRPMQEIFRCDDLVVQVGDYWVYKPDLKKLKQKVLMPVGSCQIAPAFAERGKEIWRRQKQKVGYVTVLHSSEAYVCGAIALAQSIIRTNSKQDLVLLHDSSITPKSLIGLRAAGWKTRLIQPIRSPFAAKDSYNEWNYSKLRIWQLTDYDKIIFLDADMIVLKKMNKFFVYPQLSATGNHGLLFNSGLMVIEPSMCVFEDLMSKTDKLASYNGGDQGFLNEAFTWWHRLPSKVNYKRFKRQGGDVDYDKNDEIPDDIYAIHFLGWKPWMCYRDYDCNWDMVDHHIFASDKCHEKWWQVYDAMPKKLQEFCGLTQQMDERIREWREIAKNLSLADGHWKINAADPRQFHFVE